MNLVVLTIPQRDFTDEDPAAQEEKKITSTYELSFFAFLVFNTLTCISCTGGFLDISIYAYNRYLLGSSPPLFSLTALPST
jgi:hypothetical protein